MTNLRGSRKIAISHEEKEGHVALMEQAGEHTNIIKQNIKFHRFTFTESIPNLIPVPIIKVVHLDEDELEALIDHLKKTEMIK